MRQALLQDQQQIGDELIFQRLFAFGGSQCYWEVVPGFLESLQLVVQLFTLIVIIAAIWLVSWAARRLQDLANAYFEARVMRDLFSNAFEYLIGHSYNFFISHFAGSLTHRVSKFARAFETLFDAVILQFFPTFLFVAGAVTVLFIRNHTLGAALGL